LSRISQFLPSQWAGPSSVEVREGLFLVDDNLEHGTKFGIGGAGEPGVVYSDPVQLGDGPVHRSEAAGIARVELDYVVDLEVREFASALDVGGKFREARWGDAPCLARREGLADELPAVEVEGIIRPEGVVAPAMPLGREDIAGGGIGDPPPSLEAFCESGSAAGGQAPLLLGHLAASGEAVRFLARRGPGISAEPGISKPE